MIQDQPDYDFRAPLLVIADTPGAAATAAEAAAGAGRRVARTLSFAEAVSGLGGEPDPGGILIEAREIGDSRLDAVLAQVAMAAARDIPVVVALGTSQIDSVWSQLSGPAVGLLCDPTVTDRVAAIALMPIAAARVHDTSRSELERLRALNAEVARIAEALARLSRGVEEGTADRAGFREAPSPFGGEPAAARPELEARDVRNLIRARQMRANHFPAGLFADPAWDMLLDLLAAELEDRRVSVSSLCIAAAVPGTTALRWIGTMVDSGLFERNADQLDRRRAYIGLSEQARAGLLRYFDAVRHLGLRPA